MDTTTEMTVNGRSYWVNEAYYPRFWRHVRRGRWEPWTFAVLEEHLSQAHSYVDVGAWIGPTLLYGAQIARQVYGLEPEPTSYAELSRNVALNPDLATRICLCQAAVGCENGMIRLGNRRSKQGGDSTSSVLVEDGLVTWQVPQIRMESFLLEHAINDCNFIKMDIEGWEFVVIPDMMELITRSRPKILLSLHPQFFPRPKANMLSIMETLSCYERFLICHDQEIDLASLATPARLRSSWELLVLPQ